MNWLPTSIQVPGSGYDTPMNPLQHNGMRREVVVDLSSDPRAEQRTAVSSRERTAGTIAVVDDHSLVRSGLISLLSRERPQLQVVYSGAELSAVLTLEPRPDLILLDLDLGDGRVDPDSAAQLVRRGSVVLVVSAMTGQAGVGAMTAAGVAGFVSKSEPQSVVLEAIDSVLRGETWTSPELAANLLQCESFAVPLTQQERRVLTLYARGLRIAAVAHALHLSPHTVKTYLKRIRAKYAAADRNVCTATDLYREAVRDGLLTPPA